MGTRVLYDISTAPPHMVVIGMFSIATLFMVKLIISSISNKREKVEKELKNRAMHSQKRRPNYRRKPIDRVDYNIGELFIQGFMSVLLFVFSFSIYFAQLDEQKLLFADKCEVVEGTVENFHPMPYEGHTQESFTIKGVEFSYSDFTLNPGFNQTKSHGGPIDAGMNLRIWHIGNEILKIEEIIK